MKICMKPFLNIVEKDIYIYEVHEVGQFVTF